LAELKRPAVERTGNGIPVDVEGPRMATGYKPVGADRFGQEFTAFVPTDDGGPDVVIVVLGSVPLRCRAQPVGDEAPKWPLAVPVPRHEDPAPAGPMAFVKYAVAGGDHEAPVGRSPKSRSSGRNRRLPG
jgi:hypothetical protein